MALTKAERARIVEAMRLLERADPWERRFASNPERRRKVFVTIDLEHRRDVLEALSKMEKRKERGVPAIRKLLVLIETQLHGEHQRLPWDQAEMGRVAGLTPTQVSAAVKVLARQRVLCCRSETKGRQSPTWEVYAGYASRLSEKRIWKEMERQNATDFPEHGAQVIDLQTKLDEIGRRYAGEGAGGVNDDRQPELA